MESPCNKNGLTKDRLWARSSAGGSTNKEKKKGLTLSGWAVNGETSAHYRMVKFSEQTGEKKTGRSKLQPNP